MYYIYIPNNLVVRYSGVRVKNMLQIQTIRHHGRCNEIAPETNIGVNLKLKVYMSSISSAPLSWHLFLIRIDRWRCDKSSFHLVRRFGISWRTWRLKASFNINIIISIGNNNNNNSRFNSSGRPSTEFLQQWFYYFDSDDKNNENYIQTGTRKPPS